MFSAIFAVLFGLSLLPGRKPLCLRFAERISGGIMPDGAEVYCRRLTWIWFVILLGCAAAGGGLPAVFLRHDAALHLPLQLDRGLSAVIGPDAVFRVDPDPVQFFRQSGVHAVVVIEGCDQLTAVVPVGVRKHRRFRPAADDRIFPKVD